MQDSGTLEKNSIKAINGLNALEVPIWLTQQYTRGLGPTIEPVRRLIPEDKHLEKIAFSCCGEPRFTDLLANQSRKTILLLGIESHVCVLQTAIDLQEAGWTPVVVEDCTSSRKPGDKKVAMHRLMAEGIRTTTYESLLFELCRSADSQVFKVISKIVK